MRYPVAQTSWESTGGAGDQILAKDKFFATTNLEIADCLGFN